jgi:hypothetical protein
MLLLLYPWGKKLILSIVGGPQHCSGKGKKLLTFYELNSDSSIVQKCIQIYKTNS